MDVKDNDYISPEGDIRQIAEKLLEESKSSNVVRLSYFKDKTNDEPCICYQRFDSVPQMQTRGYLKIKKQLNSVYPRGLSEFDTQLVNYPVYQVEIFPEEIQEFLSCKPTSTVQIKKDLPPKEWQLVEQDKRVFLQKNGRTLYIFSTDWAQKYKFFKCLWNHYNQYVPYKQIYEYESKLTYPEKKVTKVNRNIRSVFTKLKIEMKELPVSIEIKRGAKLTLKT